MLRTTEPPSFGAICNNCVCVYRNKRAFAIQMFVETHLKKDACTYVQNVFSCIYHS